MTNASIIGIFFSCFKLLSNYSNNIKIYVNESSLQMYVYSKICNEEKLETMSLKNHKLEANIIETTIIFHNCLDFIIRTPVLPLTNYVYWRERKKNPTEG